MINQLYGRACLPLYGFTYSRRLWALKDYCGCLNFIGPRRVTYSQKRARCLARIIWRAREPKNVFFDVTFPPIYPYYSNNYAQNTTNQYFLRREGSFFWNKTLFDLFLAL